MSQTVQLNKVTINKEAGVVNNHSLTKFKKGKVSFSGIPVKAAEGKSKFFVAGSFMLNLFKGRKSSSVKEVAKPVNKKGIEAVETAAREVHANSNPFISEDHGVNQIIEKIHTSIETAKEKSAGILQNNPFLVKGEVARVMERPAASSKTAAKLAKTEELQEKVKQLTPEQISAPIKERLAKIIDSQKQLNQNIKLNTGESFYNLLKMHDSQKPESKKAFNKLTHGNKNLWNEAYTAHLQHEFLGKLVDAVDNRKISKYHGYAFADIFKDMHPVNGYKDMPLLENKFAEIMMKPPKIHKVQLTKPEMERKVEQFASKSPRTQAKALVIANENLVKIRENQKTLNNELKEKTGTTFAELRKMHNSANPEQRETFNRLTQDHKDSWDKAYTAHLHHDFLGNFISAIEQKKLSRTNREYLLKKSENLNPVNGYKELPKLQARLDQVNLSPQERLANIIKKQQELNLKVEKKTGTGFYELLKMHNSKNPDEKETFDWLTSTRGKRRAWNEAYTAHLHHEFLGKLVPSIEENKLSVANERFLVKRSANLNPLNGYKELPKLQARLDQVNLTPQERLANIIESQKGLNLKVKEKTGTDFYELLEMHNSKKPEIKETFKNLTSNQETKKAFNEAYTAHLHRDFLDKFILVNQEGKLSKANGRLLIKESANINPETGYRKLPSLDKKLKGMVKANSQVPEEKISISIEEKINQLVKKQTELNQALQKKTGRSFYEMLNMHRSQDPEIKEAFKNLTNNEEKKNAWNEAYTTHLHRDFLGNLERGVLNKSISKAQEQSFMKKSEKLNPVDGYKELPKLQEKLSGVLTEGFQFPERNSVPFMEKIAKITVNQKDPKGFYTAGSLSM